MQPTTHIQEVINARADNKLKDEIKLLHNTLYNGLGYKLLKDINIHRKVNDKDAEFSLAYILSEEWYGFGKEIFEMHKETYRKSETALFLQEVSELKDKVNELQSQLEDLQNA